ncbi:hypothetical protein PENSPDRAFT_346724 [Peniophora sp. CONT]|nr:hypothetical protein PENSPDRAFT_346724 [Peniophora sp. CONT]
MALVETKLQQFALARKREANDVLAYLSTGFSNGFSDVWYESAEMLCSALEIPNLETRAGLKKVHGEFKAIQARLNASYKHFRQRNHYNGMGGLVTIYVTICMGDTILQDRLVDNGLFDKFMDLLEEPSTRNMSLMALNSLTRMAGKRLSALLVDSLPVLLHIRRQHPEDQVTQSLAISIVARCAMAQTASATQALSELPLLITNTLDALRDPDMTAWTFRHGLLFLKDAIGKAPELCASHPSFISFYVALMRSSDLRRRMQALDGLWKLVVDLPQPEVAEAEPVNAFSLVAAVEKNPLPRSLTKISNAFCRDNCVLSMLKRARDNVSALLAMSAMPNPNYVVIGRGLASEMEACPYMVGDLVCGCCGERSAQTDDGPMLDILKKCAEALRATGKSKHARWAVTLELRALAISRQNLNASDAEKYNLTSVYASDVVHVCHRMDLFPLVKKALRQPEGRPAWIQRMMRSDAAHYALLRAARDAGVCDEERVALLHSAREDSIKLMEVDVAPPDSLSSQGDSAMYILSAMMLDPSLTIESPDIKNALDRVAVNKRFLAYLGNPVRPKATVLQVSNYVTDNVKGALVEWGGMLDRVAELAERDERAQLLVQAESRGSEQLHLWLDRFEQKEESQSQCLDCTDDVLHTCEPEVEFTCRKMLFCSWCRRPSAVLKKCAGCRRTTYCDSECQRLHWKKGHRDVCGKTGEESKQEHVCDSTCE